MSKIDIDLKIINNEEEITKKISGIINTNRIVYIDEDVKTTIVLDDKVLMKRESSEYILDFTFLKNTKTNGNYILSSYNLSIPLYIDTKELIIKDNYLLVKYKLLIDKEDKGIYTLEIKYKKI